MRIGDQSELTPSGSTFLTLFYGLHCFYCSIEMSVPRKTLPVDSVEALLNIFAQNIQSQYPSDIKFRLFTHPQGTVEARLQTSHTKERFLVWPRLNPSRKLLEGSSHGAPVLLLCPHIPDLLAADLREAGIHHADLNGRLFLKTPSFLLDREPKRHAYRNPSNKFNSFTPKPSRVVRVLLSHREQEWTQADLQSRTRISRALVSLTLTDLVDRGLVEQTRAGSRHAAALYRVRDFEGLLDAWIGEDEWRKRVHVQQFSVLAGNVAEVAQTARDALGASNVFFTQWFAAHLKHPYTTPQLASAYVGKKPLPKISWARQVDNGGNLWLITPRDEGVFQESQTVAGFNLVSDVQIYLDLLHVGHRGPEQAQALRDWEGFAR
jgi:hypothetical protein